MKPYILALVDLDGTLVNNKLKKCLGAQRYYTSGVLRTLAPNPKVVEFVKALHLMPFVKVVYLTGRSGDTKIREASIDNLRSFGLEVEEVDYFDRGLLGHFHMAAEKRSCIDLLMQKYCPNDVIVVDDMTDVVEYVSEKLGMPVVTYMRVLDNDYLGWNSFQKAGN